MIAFLVHNDGRQCVNGEMPVRHIHRCGIEKSVRLKMFCDRMISVPQKSILLADKRKENGMICFEHINAFGARDKLNGRPRHTRCIRQQFLFGSVTVVNKFLVSFNAGTKINN